MRKDSLESARGADRIGTPKKRWERPKVSHSDIRGATHGGINMMADPLGGGNMMS